MTTNNNTIGAMQDVNSQTGDIWEGPALGFHGNTVTPFSEPSEGFYVCLDSDSKTLSVDELKLFIAALSRLATELEK